MEDLNDFESKLEVPENCSNDFCLICCNDIGDRKKELFHTPDVLDDIFFVLSNYMKWNKAGIQFEFQDDVFPFCDNCIPTIESVFELNEQAHNLMRQIDQLCNSISADILLSRSKCERILKSRNTRCTKYVSQRSHGESRDSYNFDVKKVCAFRDAVCKRYAASVTLRPLDFSIAEAYAKEKFETEWISGSDDVELEMPEDCLGEGEGKILEGNESGRVIDDSFPNPDNDWSYMERNVKIEVNSDSEDFLEGVGGATDWNKRIWDQSLVLGSALKEERRMLFDGLEILDRVKEFDETHFIFDGKFPFEKVNAVWKCGTCRQIYKTIINLETHLLASCTGSEANTTRTNFVEISPNVYLYADKFEVMKTGEDQYECSMCTTRFSSRRRIFRHMRLHFNANKYTCGICGKGYARRYLRDDHQRMHTNEKPFVCDYCGRRYSRKSGLIIHMKGNYCKNLHAYPYDVRNSNPVFQDSSITYQEYQDSVDLKLPEVSEVNDLPHNTWNFNTNNNLHEDNCNITGDIEDLNNDSNVSNIARIEEEENNFSLSYLSVSVTYDQVTNTVDAGEIKNEGTEEESPPAKRNRTSFVEISPNVFMYANKYKALKTDKDQFKCLESDCDSVLGRAGMIRHMFYHLNAARFSCGFCGKEFSRRNRCLEHERKHANASVVACHFCEGQFPNKTKLRAHIKKVHGET